MKEKLAKLIDVKSIMTISLSVVFAYLSITERISGEQFMAIFTLIISFYFTKNTKSFSNTADTNNEDDRKG